MIAIFLMLMCCESIHVVYTVAHVPPTTMTILYVLIGIIIVGLYFMGVYNGLVTLRNRMREALSDISVQQKRRWDLIPNLIETVKGYAKHEKEVFTKVTDARTRAITAGQSGNLNNMQAAETAVSGGPEERLLAARRAGPAGGADNS